MENASALVCEHLAALRAAGELAPVLDLACGSGRNGLYLHRQGLPVAFADIRADALADIDAALEKTSASNARLWQVDLESGAADPLQGKRFGAVLVFRYLHRPLMPAIARAVLPRGLVIYETFTVDQPRFGRPTNPDYLLQHDELPGHFDGWDILHTFEGEVQNPATGHHQAIAQLVARKPDRE